MPAISKRSRSKRVEIMATMDRRTCLALVGAACGSTLLARTSAGQTRPTASRDAIRARYFPNVVLRTHRGQRVRFYDDLIKDKVVVINFMYADCEGVCPGITANLKKVQALLGDRVGRDIFMYSITLKPAQDTPEILDAYAAMHDIAPGWLFLTGDPPDVELLRRKLGFTNPDPVLDADTSEHIGNIRYGNEASQVWGACPGLAAPRWIVESLGWLDRRGHEPA
jgi:protein SCO1/2